LTPSEPEKDVGAPEHGVPGAWTRDDTFVTGVERSSSLMVEPSTDGQLSISHARNSSGGSAVGAAEPAAALVVSSMVDDAVEKSSDEPRAHLANKISADDAIENTHPAMSDKSRSSFIITRRARDESANKKIGNKRNSWADLPDDGDLGDVPEFPVINPTSSQSPAHVAVIDSRPSTPRIPSELKRKQVEPDERGDRFSNVAREKLENWFGPWTDYDQQMAALCRPGSLESDDQLKAAWHDNNRRLSLQLQNMMLRRFQKEARQVMHD
jgi:hypothetical protein